MSAATFAEGLVELYQGEVIGEVLFERMLEQCRDATERYKVAVMLQLETETKARLRPALLALGLPLAEDPRSRELGHEMADGLSELDWPAAMAALRDGIRPYVERYRAIAATAPAAHRALAESMVIHEQSLLRFAELELAGAGARSVDAIVAQLRFPLPAP